MTIVAIDYFSRKIWALQAKRKLSGRILEFMKKIYKELKYAEIIPCNGKEFKINTIKEWLEKNRIKQKFSGPHYHESNGKVEIANRAIKSALKKQNDTIKINLVKVVEAYNSLNYRGIGMSSKEALKEENWRKVLEPQEICRKECKGNSLKKFKQENKF